MDQVKDQVESHSEEQVDARVEDVFKDHTGQQLQDSPEHAVEDHSASNRNQDAGSSPVTVDIYDQAYHLRGQDPAYITQLALIVDSKMRAVAAGGTTVDSLRVAVLAALNIADHLVRVEAQYRALSGSISQTESSLRHRAENLSGLLDTILTDDRKIG